MKKGWSRQQLISILATVLIMVLLIISGPAAAITLIISASTHSADESGSFTFTTAIDIENSERVPVQNFTVTIVNTGDSADNYTCIFDSEGDNLTACSGIAITLNNNVGYASGFNYGYGQTTGGVLNVTYGNMYGYGNTGGYNSSAYPYGELSYNITWTTPAVSADTNYTIQFYAKVAGGGNYTTYQSASSFAVKVLDAAEAEEETTVHHGGGGGGFTSTSLSCSEWSACAGGEQTRTCKISDYSSRIEKQSCTAPVTPTPVPTVEPEPAAPTGAAVTQEAQEGTLQKQSGLQEETTKPAQTERPLTPAKGKGGMSEGLKVLFLFVVAVAIAAVIIASVGRKKGRLKPIRGIRG